MKRMEYLRRASVLAVLIAASLNMAACNAEKVESEEVEEKAESEENVDAITDGFTHGEEVPENASFEQLDWLDSVVYSYTPSVLEDPYASLTPIFCVYPDKPIANIDDAWLKLKEDGLLDLAEQETSVIFLFNPENGETYSSKDYEQIYKLCQAVTEAKDLDFEYTLPYSRIYMKKLYVIGEGNGADFVNQYLTDDIFSGMISANVLIGATEVPEEKNYAIPAYLINCNEDVVSFYQEINETDAEDTVEGNTVYYNSSYVMDSGYTPKRIIISESDITALDSDTVQEAWDVLLKRLWRSNLENSFLVEGIEGGVVSDRPVPEELNLTVNVVTGEEGSFQSRWHEWVPNEVYETMENGTDETYPLIVLMHGSGDHEVADAESDGWVQLAGEERLIVVGLSDLYGSAAPPESAEPRYGEEYAAFIRDVICEKYPVDMSRIYMAGFSIGSFITTDTASAAPELITAAAPITYPADGYMQIFPYKSHDTDAKQYDMPLLYLCGRGDGGNTMPNPTDSEASRVMSTQLLINEVLTFNEMTDQLIDLVDFDYDWYPGEKDIKKDRQTGELVGEGYDFWDGTAASYITQNLDFEAYPFYGFDVLAAPNTTQETLLSIEGIEYDRNVYYNEEGWPMVEFLVMGEMGHNPYNRYARMVWEDLFSHYSRDPETGILSYDSVQASK